jgi:uncharacterized protein (DUF433 family)
MYLPNYQIGEAAAYAQIAPQTVASWHNLDAALLSQREKRAALSYMQLIEVAVVAGFRKMGVPLKNIRATRDYAKNVLRSEYPFAEYQFKKEAKHLYLDSNELGDVKPNIVVQADQGGQLAWENVIGKLEEFDYENDDGRSSPIIIDPRISFGAPAIKGTPTWIIRGRWDAGESDSDIADDFGISPTEVREALKFERVPIGRTQSLAH